jgi:putative ABC transport system ATP-binding protein
VRSSDNAVVCRDVERAYHLDAAEVPALRGVDLTLPRGSFTALVGPSGSGKSTLLRLLACVDRADKGAVLIDGTDVTRLSRGRRVRLRRKRIGYMFQNPADNLLEYLSVRQHLVLGAKLRGMRGVRGGKGGEVAAMLDRLGLTDRADHLPHQLSGGEQQRTAIGFAALGPPAVLVADEPTGQLDHGTVASVLAAFVALAETGVAVVAATHDPAVANRADQVIHLRDGQVTDR